MTLLGTLGVSAAALLVFVIAFAVYITVSMNANANREDVIVSSGRVADDPMEFIRAFNGAAGRHSHEGNEVSVYQNGAEIFPPMLEAIAAAKSTVHFATFIYGAGKVPDTFAAALIAAARRGVKVRAVLDSNGAANAPRELIKKMTDAGCQVSWFLRAQWYDWERYNHRSHRRLLVVDGSVGFTGGVGIADDWSGNGDSPKHWRDTHVRIIGPSVASLQAAFIDSWNSCTNELPLDAALFPSLKTVGQIPICIVQSNPSGGTSSAQRAYAGLIAGAGRTLAISNAYFLPSPPFVSALIEAKARGVDVKVIMPGPYHDEPAVRRASRRTWEPLLAGGVELYEYQRTMIHAKVVVVDGLVTSIGSINFDPRSFTLNAECAAVILDEKVSADAMRVFADDLAQCKRVTMDDVRNRGFVYRIGDSLCYWIRAQL
ncbi:MAG: phosphatidylserine/phosphatidylglycerophosphate/cardiolipin synthase family protein [Gemmatimonadota bacterium]|nr:phosphatidylserine/phosphatidylglycerophosphate/cardiolipin synthase family protein [Gemmatimonadota bacterium]